MSPANFTPIDDLVKKYNQAKGASFSAGSKESEPPRTQMEIKPVPEVSENSRRQDPGAFIDVKKEEITLDEDLKNAGVQAVTDSTIPPYLNIKNFPVSDDRVMQGLKQPIYTPIRWLATIAVYLLWKAHIQLKTVHGKVIRVLRR